MLPYLALPAALLIALGYVLSSRQRLARRARELEAELKLSRDAEEKLKKLWGDQQQKNASISAELAGVRDEMKLRQAQQQRAVSELQRRTEEFRVVFNSVPALIWIKDLKNRILRVNQRAADALALSAQQIEGRPTADFYPDEAEKYHLDDLEVIRSQKPKLGIVEVVQEKSGDKQWVQTDKVPFRDADGNIAGVIVLSSDITERKLLDERIQQAQKMEAIGQLAGGVAHDFNNLMCVIQGCADLLKLKSHNNPVLLPEIEIIQDAVARGSDLTRQMLAFSRRQVLAPRIIDLNTVLKNLEPLLRRLLTETMKIELDLSPDLGRVRADPAQIEQTILNLCLNARDAMPNGGTLTISTENSILEELTENGVAQPRTYVQCSVQDTGSGMDEKTQQRIFEPFFTTKPKGKGSGLGLATVYGIMKQSGGSVTFTSEPGKGSRFSIFLPRVYASADALEAPHQEPAQPPGSGGETLLLVEDELSLRTVYTRLLQARGYRVIAAGSGEEAAAILDKSAGTIDVVITDMVMSKMSGWQLGQLVRSVSPATKVIYMSGYTPDAVVREDIRLPGTAFIQKPFAPAALEVALRELLSRSAVEKK